MSRARRPIGVAVAIACALALPGTIRVASLHAQALVPPALSALEQKTAQAHFDTVRFAARFSFVNSPNRVSSNGSTGAEKYGRGVFATRGVASLSPSLLATTSTTTEWLNGAPRPVGAPLRERRIGATTYIYSARVAHYDGGRPWVRNTMSRDDEKLATVFASPAAIDPLLAGLESPNGLSGEPFAPLLADLKSALEVSEIGPASVDGQSTTGFLAIMPSPFGIAGPRSRRRQLHDHEPSLMLEVWFSPSGLPVRTITIDPASGGFTVQQDILALEVPVSVHAPPARETISLARLTKLEERRAKRRGR